MLTVEQFNQKFPTDEACRNYLFRLRWPNGFCCPKCGNIGYSHIKKRHLFKCLDCHTQTSVTAGTIFHGTKLPLSYWLFTFYLVAFQYNCSGFCLSRLLHINYRTGLRMLRAVRQAMRKMNGAHPLANMNISISDDENLISHSNQDHDPQTKRIVERAKRYMVKKAKQYIQHVYRSVKHGYFQAYFDEFYFKTTRRSGIDTKVTVLGLLQSAVTAQPLPPYLSIFLL